MARVQCQACLGIYETVQADGSAYFHVCAPIRQCYDAQGLKITAADAEGIVKLGGAAYERFELRPNHRDENPVPSGDPKKPWTVKSIGAGTLPAPAPAAGPPPGATPIAAAPGLPAVP